MKRNIDREPTFIRGNQCIVDAIENIIRAGNNSSDLFSRLVEEAVLIINDALLSNAKSWAKKNASRLNDGKQEALIRTVSCFEISEELKLKCGLYNVYNWGTGRDCLHESYQFKSKEEAEHFINAILDKLPKEIKIKETYLDIMGRRTSYSFELLIKI